MEPTSLTAAAIATLIVTKAFEKTGEKLSDNVWSLASKFLSTLKGKDPQTATAIERVAQKPELAQQEPVNYGEAVLISKVEQVVNQHPELQQLVQALASEVNKEKPSVIQSFSKMAEEIKAEKGSMVAQQMTIEQQTNNFY